MADYYVLQQPPLRQKCCSSALARATCAVALIGATAFLLSVTLRASADSSPRQSERCGPGKILITGYEAWGDLSHNPAEDVARSLHLQCAGKYRIESWTLPVSETGARRTADLLESRTEEAPWVAIIHLGFESAAKGLKLEVVAINVRAQHPRLQEPGGAEAIGEQELDKQGRCSARADSEIERDAPCLLATTAPLGLLDFPLIQETNATQETVEMWSRDGGTFYCNEVYFRTLHVVRRKALMPHLGRGAPPGALLPVVFVHLPPAERGGLGGERGRDAAEFVLDIAKKMTLQ